MRYSEEGLTKEQLHQVNMNSWSPDFVRWVDANHPGKWDALNAAYNKWVRGGSPHGVPEGYLVDALGMEAAIAWVAYYKLTS